MFDTIRSVLRLLGLLAFSLLVLGACDNQNTRTQTVARIWDEQILAAIRIDLPRPPVHARNLWHVSLAMYDAWAIYDPTATGYLTNEKITGLSAEEIGKARDEAISYAAYRILKDRYFLSVNAEKSLAAFDEQMSQLGYDVSVTTTAGNSPAAVGNRVAANVLDLGATDGSDQADNYADSSYTSANPPLIVKFPGNDSIANPNTWQALTLDVAFTQNGIPVQNGVQKYVCPQWAKVKSFALAKEDGSNLLVDPFPPPRLGTTTDAQFKEEMFEVVKKGALVSPDFAETIDISPGAYGNNPLGSNAGTGHNINPATSIPYSPHVVKLGDFARVLAEFWADGPHSETPPGHWNVLANEVSDNPLTTHRFEGQGSPLNRLEWDVKLYFALNAAAHDAAINSWGLKRVYETVRPVSAIRYLATQGDLPLEEGISERIMSDADVSSTGKYPGIKCCTKLTGEPAPCVDSEGTPGLEVSCVGETVVRGWPGTPTDAKNQYSGVKWIRAEEWIPYQLSTFVTPAFPGYNSGHSTFSRAAAEVLAAFTGSEFFPGGFAEFIAEKNSFLKFEKGPSEEVRLQWATYFDAADQAGQSRLFGGIHIRSDDLSGRIAGAEVGKKVFEKAKDYFTGNAQSISLAKR